MKKLLPVFAVLLLISAIGMILVRVSGRDLDALSRRTSVTKSIVPTLGSPRVDSNSIRTRTRRPTLEESLPPGAKLIESIKSPGGIGIILADGSNIFARGASITENGISLEGPYEFKGPDGSVVTSDIGSVILLARDGNSLEMISGPGGTSVSMPLENEDAEQEVMPPDRP